MDMKTMAMVSVIVPSYNHGHFLGESIESVMAQTYPQHEIIVIDDGSTDKTREVVTRYPKVRYVWQRNQGLPAARNRGIRESRGEYVVFLDADDRLLPRHLEISLEAFRSHPDAGWVCGSFCYFGNEPPFRPAHPCHAWPDRFAGFLHCVFFGAVHAAMYRRKVLVESGGFDERLRTSEDREFYLRLSRQAPLHCHHQLVAEYRVSDQQLTRQWHVMLKSDYSIQRKQWPLVRGNPTYEKAYRDGMAFLRNRYGERALWQMVSDARAGQWRRASTAFWILLRCYPSGLLNLFKGKARKLFLIRKFGCS
jgi:glycosyltransferase involved in cell wall biosynthesis